MTGAWTRTTQTLRRGLVPIAWLNLIGNILIIATGGAVRLTGSGLGCSTWPMCTAASWVPVPADGIHGLIEFGNRLMSPVLLVLAALALLASWSTRSTRRDLWVHALIIAGGVIGQGVLGGIVVLTQLNMSTVGWHYFISAALVGVCASFVLRASRPAGPREPAVPSWLRIMTHVSSALLVGVVVGGIITTGNGPHSGDVDVIRDSAAWEQLVHVHAWLSYAFVAVLLVILIGSVVLRARRLLLASIAMLIVVGVQVTVGIIQARLGIPPLLVGIHMVLAAVSVAIGVSIVDATRRPRHD